MKQDTNNNRRPAPRHKVVACVLCVCLFSSSLSCAQANGGSSCDTCSQNVSILGQWQAVMDPATAWPASWHVAHTPWSTTSPGQRTCCFQHTMFLNHSVHQVLHSQESCSSAVHSDRLLHTVQSTCTAPASHQLDARLVYTVHGTGQPVYGCATASLSSSGSSLHWCDYGPGWQSQEEAAGACLDASHVTDVHTEGTKRCSQLVTDDEAHLDMTQVAGTLGCESALEAATLWPTHSKYSTQRSLRSAIWLIHTTLQILPLVVAVLLVVMAVGHIVWQSIRWPQVLSAVCAHPQDNAAAPVSGGPQGTADAPVSSGQDHTQWTPQDAMPGIIILACFECCLWAVYYCLLLPGLFCGTASMAYRILKVLGGAVFAAALFLGLWCLSVGICYATNGWAMLDGSRRRRGIVAALRWLRDLDKATGCMNWQCYKVEDTPEGGSLRELLGEEELHLSRCEAAAPIRLPFPIAQSPELFCIKVNVDCQPADAQAEKAWQQAKQRLEDRCSAVAHPHRTVTCARISVMNETQLRHGSETCSHDLFMNETPPSAIVINEGRSTLGSILMQPWVVCLCACFGLGWVWALWAERAVPVLALRLVKQYSVDPDCTSPPREAVQ